MEGENLRVSILFGKIGSITQCPLSAVGELHVGTHLDRMIVRGSVDGQAVPGLCTSSVVSLLTLLLKEQKGGFRRTAVETLLCKNDAVMVRFKAWKVRELPCSCECVLVSAGWFWLVLTLSGAFHGNDAPSEPERSLPHHQWPMEIPVKSPSPNHRSITNDTGPARCFPQYNRRSRSLT